MSYVDILYENQDQTAILPLNRPERLNAFTWVMGQEMRQALGESEQDPDIRATIITGAGRGFCAGADMSGGDKTFDGSNRPAPKKQDETRVDGSAVKYYFSLKKPVIVAYNGRCRRCRGIHDASV